MWLAREQAARDAGYEGLRLTGNTFWLEPHQWSAFADYERTVNAGFQGRRVVALCSYCLPRCSGSDVLDVVRNHAFAVARRAGEWEVVESAAVALANSELRQLNQELDARVLERTTELRQAVADNEVLFQELHHRVRNNLQVIRSLLALKARQIEPGEPARAFADAADRINAIGLAHDMLYRQGAAAELDMEDYLRGLADALLDSHDLAGRIDVAVHGGGATLGLTEATPVGMIANEVLLNALLHGFPDGRTGRVEIACARGPDAFTLTIRDDGVGTTEPFEAAATPLGGLAIVRGLAAQLGGGIELRQADGVEFRLEFPIG